MRQDRGSEGYPRFSGAEYERRYALARREMERRGLDLLIVFGDSGHGGGFQANCHYLSNYVDQFYSYVVFPLRGEPTLLFCLQPHEGGVRRVSVIEDIRWGGWDITGAAAARVRELGLERGRLGLVGVSSFQVRFTWPSDHLDALRGHLPEAEFQVATDLFEDLRLLKSEEEIEAIRKGAELTDLAMRAVEEETRPGMPEGDLWAIAADAVFRAGGWPHVMMFGSTPMADPDLTCPRPRPSRRRLEKGDVVLTEISAAYNHYSGQIVRPLCIGEPTRSYRELFDLALGVHDAIAASLRPDNTEKDVVAALEPIRARGLQIICSGVHGWAQTLERPTIGIPGMGRWKEGGVLPFTFQPNMTLMIEPNPVTLDGKQGMFFGNLHRITPSGAENLQKFPSKLIVVG